MGPGTLNPTGNSGDRGPGWHPVGTWDLGELVILNGGTLPGRPF